MTLKDKDKYFKIFFTFFSQIQEASSLEEKFQYLAKAVQAAGWRSVVIYLYDQDLEITNAYFFGLTEEEIESLKSHPLDRDKRKILFDNHAKEYKISQSYYIRHDSPISRMFRWKLLKGREPEKIKNGWHPFDLAYIPMQGSSRILGLIGIDNPVDGRIPDQGFFSTIEVFTRTVALEIEKYEFQKKLMESEDHFRNLVENANDIIFTTDVSGNFLTINKKAENLLGIDRKEIIGEHFANFLLPEQKELSISTFKSAIKSLPTQPFEVRILTNTGKELVFEVKGIPIYKSNKLCGFEGIAREITYRKNIELTILRTEKLAAIGEMITGITHELNNKLTPILGYTQILLSSKLEAKYHSMLETIEEAVIDAKNIVESLLAFGRSKDTQKEFWNVNEIIKSTLKLCQFEFKRENVLVETNLTSTIPKLFADKIQLSQVILNILNNSRQALEGWRQDKKIVISTLLKKKNIIIRIEDNGPGIPEDIIHKIFDPFFTTKGLGKSTGLGLSLCFGIIKSHGGKIDVSSELGEGVVFTIELPVGKTEKKIIKEFRPASDVHTRARILVIDDELEIRNMIAEFLSKNHEINVAGDGKTAIELLKLDSSYDIILLDLRMPVMDGFELYHWISSHMQELAGRIIFSTGDTYDERTGYFIENHKQNAVLIKPFNLKKVESTVSQKLGELGFLKKIQ